METVLEGLLAKGARDGFVELDELGDACSLADAGPDEVDALVTELESRGVVIRGPEGGGGEGRLRVVLEAARALRAELGRTPTPAEIAERSGLDVDRVRQALALARVISR